MSDPKRLIDQQGALAPDARRLMEAGRDLAPPPGAVDRGWSDFLALNGMPPSDPGQGGGSAAGPAGGSGLPGAGGNGLGGVGAAGALGVAGAPAGSALASATLLQTFALGAALGVVAVLGVQGVSRVAGSATPAAPSLAPAAAHPPPGPNDRFLVQAPSSVPATTPGAPARAPAPAGVHDVPVRDPEPLTAAPEAEAARPVPTGSVASFAVDGAGSESLVRAEARDIAQARAMIASGQASEALVFLGRSSERFKAGTLGQEREVLIIEALVGSGQRAVAERRARDFLARHPQSPLAERVKGVVP